MPKSLLLVILSASACADETCDHLTEDALVIGLDRSDWAPGRWETVLRDDDWVYRCLVTLPTNGDLHAADCQGRGARLWTTADGTGLAAMEVRDWDPDQVELIVRHRDAELLETAFAPHWQEGEPYGPTCGTRRTAQAMVRF